MAAGSVGYLIWLGLFYFVAVCSLTYIYSLILHYFPSETLPEVLVPDSTPLALLLLLDSGVAAPRLSHPALLLRASVTLYHTS